MTDVMVRHAIGGNVEYYLKRFAIFQTNRFAVVNWNWSAFFFGGLWLLYRKIWPALFVAVVIIALGAVILMEPMLIIAFLLAFGIFTSIVMGLIGNWIYYQWIRFAVRVLRKRSDPSSLERRLSFLCGTLKLT